MDTTRKTLRFYPDRDAKHRAILDWLKNQRGADSENLIHLMTQGLKVETSEISQGKAESLKPTLDSQGLLLEISKVVNSAVQNAMRDANIQIGTEDQTKAINEETQAFLRDMADTFS
ncbi:MAG: hypothetical protein DRI56_13680 [Chloroflexota bacterium]|nr:MAG: hypothetical protein DRI56_13680 [Chloroflexota bacterium]